MVQQRVLETTKGRFLFRVRQPARNFLLREGTDLMYGARHLKRAVERHVVYPLARLLATEQVSFGDVVSMDWDGSEPELTFSKEVERGLAWGLSDGRALVFSPAMAVPQSSDSLR